MQKLFLSGAILYCTSSLAFAQADAGKIDCPSEISVPNAPPKYPAQELRDGIGGTVMLLIAIDACGRPLDITVQKSSKNINLDKAAMNAARSWKFPASAKIYQGIVPVRFTPDRLPGPESFNPPPPGDDSPPLVYNDAALEEDGGLGTMKGYIADDRPWEVDDFDSARKTIDQYCLLESKDEEAGMKSYATYGFSDFSFWWVFSDQHPMGPSVVRFRYFPVEHSGYMKVAYRCDSKRQGACDRLLALLEELPDQKMFAPPPAPPPPPAVAGKLLQSSEKEMLGCK